MWCFWMLGDFLKKTPKMGVYNMWCFWMLGDLKKTPKMGLTCGVFGCLEIYILKNGFYITPKSMGVNKN